MGPVLESFIARLFKTIKTRLYFMPDSHVDMDFNRFYVIRLAISAWDFYLASSPPFPFFFSPAIVRL